MSEFGDRVRAKRIALGLSQKELAAKIGCEPQSVSNWECDRGEPWRKRAVEIITKIDAMSGPTRRRAPVGDRL